MQQAHMKPTMFRNADPFPLGWIEQAKAHAVSCYPMESCGFMVEDGYMPCDNVHSNPLEHFEVNPEDTLIALQRGARALVHSHPDGPNFPTFDDQESQISTDMTWGIIPVIGTDDGDVKVAVPSDVLWWGDDLPVAPLERRLFIWGIFHCYSLYRDWWRLERGVLLPNFACDANFIEQRHNIFIDNCERAGLRNLGKIDMSNLQIGDMLVGHIKGPFPNHCGVYIGGDDFLHHPDTGISGKTNLLRWWPRVDTVMRYDDQNATSLREAR